MATANTVHGRIESARPALTTPRVALGLALLAILGFTLLFVQEPLVHDSLHNARHAAGITCH
ncbi:cobalamin cluster protein [Halorientalis sp. IM1011]|uniref:CbtB domain-containing protein n=1 Tax=Halorientalis sp. IM1011 TaxID=1932360 RepID=UPI00097CCD08|nr:CbtB domain-containing protein [Halorientalis sp. IM1011]AQL43967.1 cobalamin cluster protein [Halorientalis sp. IM1011]